MLAALFRMAFFPGMLRRRSQVRKIWYDSNRNPHDHTKNSLGIRLFNALMLLILVALIVPDREWVQSWAEATGQTASLTNIMNSDELRKALTLVIDRVNRQLSPVEKIRRFMVAPNPFEVDNGMLTPTLKIRRHQIRETYGQALDALYEEKTQSRNQTFR